MLGLSKVGSQQLLPGSSLHNHLTVWDLVAYFRNTKLLARSRLDSNWINHDKSPRRCWCFGGIANWNAVCFKMINDKINAVFVTVAKKRDFENSNWKRLLTWASSYHLLLTEHPSRSTLVTRNESTHFLFGIGYGILSEHIMIGLSKVGSQRLSPGLSLHIHLTGWDMVAYFRNTKLLAGSRLDSNWINYDKRPRQVDGLAGLQIEMLFVVKW